MKYSKRRPPLKRQAGAALIIALLIVFIVASLSVTISSDFLVMIRRVENQTHSNQAYAYLVGAEGLGRWAVLEDENLTSDHLGELFLAEPIVLPINHADQLGQYTGAIIDLQGRLKINNLLPAAGSTSAKADQQRFIRLLQTLELETPLDQQTAEEITNAVIDWLDTDIDERQPGGAEDLFYGDAIPAGRAANRKMVSISELLWVKGVTTEIYQALKPHLTVWGKGEININTASENVLRSLNKDDELVPLSVAEIATLVASQEEKAGGYDDVKTVFESPPLKDLNINIENLSVDSEAFLLKSVLVFQDREFVLNSVIQREPGKAAVVARSRTGF